MILRRVKVGQPCQRGSTPDTLYLKPKIFINEFEGSDEKTFVLVGIGGNYHSGVALVPLVTNASLTTFVEAIHVEHPALRRFDHSTGSWC
jgi:hypothetical protein